MATLTCIACLRDCGAAAPGEYQRLVYFDDLCICRECLEEARSGAARLAGNAARPVDAAGD
ncbi:MAG TPA: hypothetical protein VK066_17225 [Chloroflexota bacterium]|nr:hypothetical protein [Chloroflexota bacterium]